MNRAVIEMYRSLPDIVYLAMAAQPIEPGRLLVFDWDRAALLIKTYKPQLAEAGLWKDWSWTGCTIYRGGKIVSSDDGHLSSCWAIPELILDDAESVACFRYVEESPGWESDTKWPATALEMLT